MFSVSRGRDAGGGGVPEADPRQRACAARRVHPPPLHLRPGRAAPRPRQMGTTLTPHYWH